MISASPALDALRNATRDIHANLEETLAIARPEAGSKDYLSYVAALWGWLAPFETRLWRAEWPAGAGVEFRADKCAWLESDLRKAGLDEDALARIPRSDFAPPLDTLASRLGLAYVIEGAQLGGQVLQKRLARKLASPSRWLQGYGAETSRNWQAFLAVLEEHLRSESERGEAAATARLAFENLASWFRFRRVA